MDMVAEVEEEEEEEAIMITLVEEEEAEGEKQCACVRATVFNTGEASHTKLRNRQIAKQIEKQAN